MIDYSDPETRYRQAGMTHVVKSGWCRICGELEEHIVAMGGVRVDE